MQEEKKEESSKIADTVQEVKTADSVKKDCPDCKGSGYIPCPPCGETGSVQCQQCEGNGGTICDFCGGAGELNCASCDGMGESDCAACNGSGVFGDMYTGVRSECSFCGGDGRDTCAYCEGTGKKECMCGGKAYCDNCQGKGYKDCATCTGQGKILCKTCGGSGSRPDNNSTAPADTAPGSASPDSTPPGGTAAAAADEGIHPCPNCEGEGRVGKCLNCDRKGYDKKIQQICLECINTGKNLCETCEGYGMLDSNGNGVSADTPSVAHHSGHTDSLHGSSGRTLGRKCTNYKCEGGRCKCDVCKGGGQVKRIQNGPYYGGRKTKAATNFERCSGCGGQGYYDCSVCGGDGRMDN
ncbi:MAG: hypothetical protein E7J94_20620 [Clostridium sp.]|nr:hypothetical protein [Clostridium sp.]MDU7709671.1 hypothetical protein [Clostridium sp.]